MNVRTSLLCSSPLVCLSAGSPLSADRALAPYRLTVEANLGDCCREIAAENRNQYTLAFKPSDMGSQGRFHIIRVGIQGKRGRGLTVRTREGYYEPTGE